MDIEKICRTCLGLMGPFVSIFDGSSVARDACCIADMLHDFTKIKPKPKDNLPEKVCLTCISEINRCYFFKLKCENSNRTLRQLFPDALSEELDMQVPIIPKCVQMMHKDTQTILDMKKSVSREVQTQTTETEQRRKDQSLQTDLPIVATIANFNNITSCKQDNGKDNIQDREQKQLQEHEHERENKQKEERGNKQTVAKSIKGKSAVKVILAKEEEQEDYDGDFYEITTAELDDVGNNEVKNSENSNSIILRVSEGVDGKYTEMIYDETTGELRSQNVEHVEDEPENKTINEYQFTIYNNENGETEIAPMTTRNATRCKSNEQIQPAEQKQMNSSRQRVKRTAPESDNLGKLDESEKKKEKVDTEIELKGAEKSFTKAKLNYFCEHCNAGFAVHKSLLIHKRQNSCTRKNFKCETCERVFVTAQHLKEHEAIHQKEQYTCSECSETFEHMDALNIHMVNVHNRSIKNQCHICKKVFTMRSALLDHMRVHTGEKPFVCTVCNKSFTQNANLRQHMFRHSNTKRFTCDICPSSFVTKAELISHKRTHTGDKPFQCEFCAARFTTSCSLTKHKRKHTGERPYACEMCPMRFTALNVLKNHRRTHTGEKPFVCQHCSRRFTQNGDCMMHQRTHEQTKIYLCPVCGEEFENMTDMRTHLEQHSDKDKNVTYALVNNMKENISEIAATVKKAEMDEEQEYLQLTMKDIC